MILPDASAQPSARRPGPGWRAVGRFLLQAGVWLVLTLAIAAMLVVGGPFTWADSLRFAAANWMPWALFAPVVVALSVRFPAVRGQLWRSLPVHLVACVGCSFAVSLISAQIAPTPFPRLSAGLLPSGGPGGVTVMSGSRIVSGAYVLNGTKSGAVNLSDLGPIRVTVGDARLATRPGLNPAGEASNPPDGATVPVSAVGNAVADAVREKVTASLRASPWRTLLVPLALRANVGFAIYFIIAAVAHSMTFYRQARQREVQALALEASRNQAKLDALRLQLHPHFLFNTLNAVSALIHRDPAAADNLIADLGELLRTSFRTGAHEVTLARELELLGHYLAIEQARLGDRLRVVREIDPSALRGLVPTLILQPLAENAVRHGLEPRLAPGTISIKARREDGRLTLTIADDGVGLPVYDLRRGGGVGIANCEERLRTLHGDRARLELSALPDGGARAVLTLPFRTSGETK